jgi:hypothetical protein
MCECELINFKEAKELFKRYKQYSWELDDFLRWTLSYHEANVSAYYHMENISVCYFCPKDNIHKAVLFNDYVPMKQHDSIYNFFVYGDDLYYFEIGDFVYSIIDPSKIGVKLNSNSIELNCERLLSKNYLGDLDKVYFDRKDIIRHSISYILRSKGYIKFKNDTMMSLYIAARYIVYLSDIDFRDDNVVLPYVSLQIEHLFSKGEVTLYDRNYMMPIFPVENQNVRDRGLIDFKSLHQLILSSYPKARNSDNFYEDEKKCEIESFHNRFINSRAFSENKDMSITDQRFAIMVAVIKENGFNLKSFCIGSDTMTNRVLYEKCVEKAPHVFEALKTPESFRKTVWMKSNIAIRCGKNKKK